MSQPFGLVLILEIYPLCRDVSTPIPTLGTVGCNAVLHIWIILFRCLFKSFMLHLIDLLHQDFDFQQHGYLQKMAFGDALVE